MIPMLAADAAFGHFSRASLFTVLVFGQSTGQNNLRSGQGLRAGDSLAGQSPPSFLPVSIFNQPHSSQEGVKARQRTGPAEERSLPGGHWT